MNIKEQLEKMLEITGTYDWEDNPDYRSMAQDISDLFKKWALEMVGEDEYAAIQGEGTDYDSPEPLYEINEVKEDIRQRIKESVK